MKLPTLRRVRPSSLPGVTGTARVDTRTKNLTRRLRPGDIAILNHLDLDRASAEALVAAGVAAVVNVAPSISGRYPNLGPGVLMTAGIPLVDDVGIDVFAHVDDGDTVRLDDGVLFRDGVEVATGVEQTIESVTLAVARARSGLASQLEAFTANTVEYLRHDRDLLLDGVGVPALGTPLDGRPVVVVVRGYDYRDDLELLGPYIREYRPVLVGVDGGADALLEAGHTPDVIVGDMEATSDVALRCGAELVVHAGPDGRASGAERLEHLGLDAHIFTAAGTSEDVALLLAEFRGAALIVAVGTHTSLVEFLDKGRAGMASMFLTRLRVGDKLVDAKTVSNLHRPRIQNRQITILLVASLLALLVALAMTPLGQDWIDAAGSHLTDLISWIRGQFA